MERILIEDMIDICDIMYDKLKNGYQSVSFVGKYEDVKVLIKELLLANDESSIIYANIEPEILCSYNKEYVVSLDKDIDIWVEKAYDKDDKCYILICDNCVLVADDCNSTILKSIDSDETYEVSYDLEDELYEDFELRNNDHETLTHVITDDNGNIKGFEKTWKTDVNDMHYHTSYSYYTNNQDMLKYMMDNFDIKF